jgi:hypothetical protein
MIVSVTLTEAGAAAHATLRVPQEDDVPRTFTATARTAALALSQALAKARKAGFAGREWSCPERGLKGRI